MTHGSRYRVPLRRRREKKTDYQARKAFVISGKPRLVARSSLKNTTAQIIAAKATGDVVLASAHSRELIRKYGWKGATGNIPAAYLTGLLCGLKAKKNGVTEAVLDLGLVSPTKGSKVFSTMAGALDAGVTIPHDDEKIVKERNQGDHIIEYAESLGTPEEYAPEFSTLIEKGLQPQNLGEHFTKVKTDIFAAFAIAWKPEAKQAKPAEKLEPKKPEGKLEAKPAPKVEVKKPEVRPEVKIEVPVSILAAVQTKETEKLEAKQEKVEAKLTPKPEAIQPKTLETKVIEAPKTEAPKAKRIKRKAEPKAKAEEKPAEVPKAKVEKKPKAKVKTDRKTRTATMVKVEKKAEAEEVGEKPAKVAKTARRTKTAKTGGKKE